MKLRLLTAEERRRLLVWALLCAGAFLAIGVAAQERWILGEEVAVQRAVQATRVRALDHTMEIVSLLGSGWVLLPLAVASCLLVGARHRRLGVALALVAAAGWPVMSLAKLIVIRQRPNTVMYAYPSSHTFGIVMFLGLLLYALWTLQAPARWRWLLAAGGAVLTLAVGASRVYLNAHWIGDVAGGLVGGAAFLLAGVLVIDPKLRPAVAPAEDSSPTTLDTVTS
jgi:membrane-associated phospholipid phosphatase